MSLVQVLLQVQVSTFSVGFCEHGRLSWKHLLVTYLTGVVLCVIWRHTSISLWSPPKEPVLETWMSASNFLLCVCIIVHTVMHALPISFLQNGIIFLLAPGPSTATVFKVLDLRSPVLENY
jgi:hypothetical protein